jgi:plastocyanin
MHEIQDKTMKGFWRNIGILAVLALLGTQVMAHEPYPSMMATSGPESGNSAHQEVVKITIQTFQFKPAKLEVKSGTQVTWINEDDIRHTVTSGDPEKRDGRFDAPLAGKGKSFSFTFSQPGTYSYFCERHDHMRGEIQVR